VPVEGGTQRVLIDKRGNYYDPLTKEPISPQGQGNQGAAISNALPTNQGGNYPSDTNAAFMSDAEIQQLADQTPQVGGVDVDGGFGVLPPRPQPAQEAAAQGIAQAAQSRFGFKPTEQGKQKPELVTLPDGTKGYGSFDANGAFIPATKDGKPMTFTEGQTLTKFYSQGCFFDSAVHHLRFPVGWGAFSHANRGERRGDIL